MSTANGVGVDRGEFDRLASRVAQHDGACVSTRDWMRLTEQQREDMRQDLDGMRTGLWVLGLVVAFLLGVGLAALLVLGGR